MCSEARLSLTADCARAAGLTSTYRSRPSLAQIALRPSRAINAPLKHLGEQNAEALNNQILAL